ncbi:MAG: hypothetical protein RR419_02325 [Akkermansia sp.]
MKQYLLIPLLACASMALASSGIATNKEKEEEVKASLEHAQIILKVAVFEALFQDTGQNDPNSKSNYGRIYRRAIVVESLRGPFKTGDYVVIVNSFEDYPKEIGNARQEYPQPKCSYYLFNEADVGEPRKDFTGMFAILNDAPLLESPTPVRQNRERFLPPIEPARFKTDTQSDKK